MKKLIRRHWLALVAGTALAGAAANVGLNEGGFVIAILALVFVGVCLGTVLPGWIAGTSVVKHAQRVEQDIAAIEDRRRKEITR